MPRAVVTGGAGFLPSHVVDLLIDKGYDVVAFDNLLTGSVANLDDARATGHLTFFEHDVSEGLRVAGPVDVVLHLASAASPPEYLAHPIETLVVGSRGTQHALDLAREHGARVLLASTSEIYGDPLEHPQQERYHGNVDPTGPRAVYDEAKRYAEAIAMAYHRTYGVDTKIARIFNTYGPRLAPGDGRVVSNFLMQADAGEPITIYGDGTQTRSFCYVADEAAGLVALLESDHVGPMNIGNPAEYTVLDLARAVLDVADVELELVFAPLPVDDPRQRRPDISLAERVLGWRPETELREGLARTLDWYRRTGDPD